MKRLSVLAALLCISAIFLRAEDIAEDVVEEKKIFRIKDRIFELGLNADVGFANNYLTATDVFQETMILDLGNLKTGLRMDLGAKVSPLYFNFNRNNNWGFGVFVNAEAAGNADISGNMLTLREADNDKFGLGAAVFAEGGAHAFFHIKKFKVKIRPAGFYPLFYIEPDMSYTFQSAESLKANFTYNVLVYSAFSNETYSELSALPGFDLSAGVEYPLFSFLDLGLDLIHIPLVPAIVKNYMQATGTIGVETDNIFDADLANLASTKADISYGTGSKNVLRPFKTLLYADYRPFNTRLFSLLPSMGFAYSPLYVQPFSMEGGLKLRLDLSNLFITTLGVNYEDRLWKNGVGITLNFRAFNIDLGLAMQSEDFLQSWMAGGLAASLGLKFGW
jgi:hypothetical protein